MPGGGVEGSDRTVLALIDTGAGSTCISMRVARGLGLHRVGEAEVRLASGTAILPIYNVDIVPLLSSIQAEDPRFVYLLVYGAELSPGNYDCLIGRDILQAGKFTYVGHPGAFTISF